MKKQNEIAKKQCQWKDKVQWFDQKNYSKNSAIKTENRKIADLNYDRRFYFIKYRNNEKIYGLSLTSKFNYLKEFHDKLQQSKKIKSASKKLKWKNFVYDNASDLYNSFLPKRRVSILNKFFSDLFLDYHEYDNQFDGESGDDKTLEDDKEDIADISILLSVEVDEKEAKEGKGLKTLPPNKLLTRLPVLFAQIKAGNNYYKLKSEIRKIVSLIYQHNGIIKKTLQ